MDSEKESKLQELERICADYNKRMDERFAAELAEMTPEHIGQEAARLNTPERMESERKAAKRFAEGTAPGLGSAT